MMLSLAAVCLASAAEMDVSGKEHVVVLRGNVCCTRCCLKEKRPCQDAVLVSEKGVTVRYEFAVNAVSLRYHGYYCSGTNSVVVTGTVTEANGVRVLTASEIKVQKQTSVATHSKGTAVGK